MREHFRMMARYNKWANARINNAISEIDEEDFMRPRAAFFGSIHGALNHLLLVDRLWRGRMINKPYPAKSLDQIVAPDRGAIIREREAEDQIIIEFVDGLSAEEIEERVSYETFVGLEGHDARRIILTHMFNHATHHRGQVHALLTQVPYDPPPLDLIYFLRETEAD